VTQLASTVLWEVLLRREPGLARLQSEAMSVRDEGGSAFCANRVWYVRFEPQLKQFVGSDAEGDDPVLRSPEAYELSRQILYRLLPDCRNCVCVPWES
jgi:hypothetical protein